MEKFIFNNNRLKTLPANDSHSFIIKKNYDYVIRGFIFNKKRVYIRINDLTYLQGIEYKRTVKIFQDNLKSCISYFRTARHKIYTSYDFNNLPLDIKESIRLF